ncbi:hypothetical protein ACJ41O_010182 [Fusarium nematophilum]
MATTTATTTMSMAMTTARPAANMVVSRAQGSDSPSEPEVIVLDEESEDTSEAQTRAKTDKLEWQPLKRQRQRQDHLERQQRRIRQRVPGPMAPPPRPKMNIRNFKEVPRIDKIARHIRIAYNGMEVAETSDAYWVLQKHKPPGSSSSSSLQGAESSYSGSLTTQDTHRYIEYYLPKSCMKVSLMPTGYGLPCHWKGRSTHYSVKGPDGTILANRVWSYEDPRPGFEAIKGYVSFYARPWQCFVDGERVLPQRSDMRGGWVTAEVVGVISADDPRF